MAQRIIIPRLGQTMTEGLVAKWYVNDGDTVQVGNDIYELEYDKSTATIQAKKTGVIRIIACEGDTVPLGETVAIILESGERLEDVLAQKTYVVANAAKTDAAHPAAQHSESSVKNSRVSAPPAVKRLAQEYGIEIADIVPSSPDGRLTKEDVERYRDKNAQVATAPIMQDLTYIASPMAKKIATELDVDIAAVMPAGGRRVCKEDVITYEGTHPKLIGADQKKPATLYPVLAGMRPNEKKRIAIRGMRKVIAERMSESYFLYPTVTLTSDTDMAELLRLRNELNTLYSSEGIKLTITDMLVKAVAYSLRDNEVLNASIDGNDVVYYEDINVAVAVALDEGLVVLVIRNADKLSIKELSKEILRLVTQAREGSLSPDDMSGATFTLTNLGAFGIDCFNPIINRPESAILGVGRTVEKPVVIDGKIEIRPRMVTSITHDHRVIDGVPAANTNLKH